MNCLLSGFAALVVAAGLAVGVPGPAGAAGADCRTGGTRLAEIYDDSGWISNESWPAHLVVHAAGASGATVLCVYVQAIAGGRHSAGGAVTLHGYQAPPGVIPAVTTDVSGCGPMRTLADGEIGASGEPVHLPYRIAVTEDASPDVCVTANDVGIRISYAIGEVGSAPSASFDPDAAAVRPDRPAYPAEDPQRPSTSCFHGGYALRRFSYVSLAGTRAYYATEDRTGYTPSTHTTCYRVEGPAGIFLGAAQTRETSPRGTIYQSSLHLDEHPSRCTTNVAGAESPIPYSLRFGVYSPYLGLDRYVVCVSAAGVEQTIAFTPGVTDDTVLYHVESAGEPPPWEHDSR